MIQCSRKDCPWHGHVLVPPYLNPASDIYVVGEAPGNTEAKVGKPFVGRAGKKLKTILAEAGINERPNIINAALCHPSEDGSISPPPREVVSACLAEHHMPFLLKLTKPSVFVLCGRTAYEALVRPVFRMGDVVFTTGQLIPKRGIWVSIYHPSYLLRQGEIGSGPLTKKCAEAIRKAVEECATSLQN